MRNSPHPGRRHHRRTSRPSQGNRERRQAQRVEPAPLELAALVNVQLDRDAVAAILEAADWPPEWPVPPGRFGYPC